MKKIIRGKEAREKLLEGSRLMYDCVTTTLGPRGNNVSISRQWGLPIVVHDGVTVAREVEAEDEFVDQGVKLIREASQKTQEEVGDATTTSCLLAYEIFSAGKDLIDAGKINAMVLRSELEAAKDLVLSKLPEISTEVKNTDEVSKVATISAANSEIGDLVAKAFEKAGKEGIVTADESKLPETTLEYVEGMHFDKGFGVYRHFITNISRNEAILRDVAVVVINKQISLNSEIVPLLEEIASTNKNMVLIGNISGDALSTLIANKMKGSINALVVEPPAHGERQINYLEDIALITGGKVLSKELTIDGEAIIDPEWIGKADLVQSNRNTTIIQGGQGDKALVKARIKQLKDQLKTVDSPYEREIIEERLAKLTTGVAVIKVGGKTEIESRERLERVKDAIGSARSALSEGIVIGGGMAFSKLADFLPDIDEMNLGEGILKYALAQPLVKLMRNAGEDDERISQLHSSIRGKGGNFGYEVNSSEIVDLVEKGIIDPTRAIRLSIENAVSVAGSMLTTEVLIVDIREKQELQ